MRRKLKNLKYISIVTLFVVTFFIAQPTTAKENTEDVLVDYFLKTYTSEQDDTGNGEHVMQRTLFGTINWLPGEEFEIFLIKKENAISQIEKDKTPEFIKENITKKIEQLQQPTAEELAQPIAARVINHNLPIAVLNVWRPHTVITVLNETDDVWSKNSTLLLSENTDGNMSFFRDTTWISDRIITTMNEPEVAPGETATFEFLLDGRGQSRLYYHVYKLEVNNHILHLDAKGSLHWLTRVDDYRN